MLKCLPPSGVHGFVFHGSFITSKRQTSKRQRDKHHIKVTNITPRKQTSHKKDKHHIKETNITLKRQRDKHLPHTSADKTVFAKNSCSSSGSSHNPHDKRQNNCSANNLMWVSWRLTKSQDGQGDHEGERGVGDARWPRWPRCVQRARVTCWRLLTGQSLVEGEPWGGGRGGGGLNMGVQTTLGVAKHFTMFYFVLGLL